MLAAVADAGPSVFHHDISDLGNSMRAYCLVELGQGEEARATLDRAGPRSRIAVDHGVRGLALSRLQDQVGAKAEMIKTIRRGVTRSGYFLTPTLLDCAERYIGQASDQDVLEVMREGERLLKRFLLETTRRPDHPRFERLWLDRMERIPAALTISDTSTFGHFIQRFHLHAIARIAERRREAFELFKHLRSDKKLKHVRISDVLAIVRNLLAYGETPDAMMVFRALREVHTLSHEQLSPVLYHLATTTGTDGGEVEELWDIISSSFEPTEADRIVVAKSRARLGRLEETIKVMPDGPTDLSVLRARMRTMLAASIRSLNADAAEQYLEASSAIEPNVKDHKNVIRLMVKLNEPERAIKVFRKLAPLGLKADRYIYTSLINIHGRRRDSQGARELFEEMQEAGVEPDGVTWATLVNAYVEAGNWKGVTQLWSEIPIQYQQHDSVTANYMKALVLQKTPFQLVMGMFQQIDAPTAYHWALILQSASDNRDMESLETLFADMQSASAASPDAPAPTVYTWSILLHAYLRRDLHQRSQVIYDQMLAAGVVPSSATYSMIIQSYAQGQSQRNLESAEEFAMSIYRIANETDSTSPLAHERISRGGTNENLLGPLVNAAGRAGAPEQAEEYFNRITEKEEPSIPLFTQYLDAWRRAQDGNMVKYVWTELFALACRTITNQSHVSSRKAGPSRTPSNALCIPLSIVLITFGKEKRLMDIKATWESVRSAGFGFDGDNFNHLAVSLAQSGDVEGAFDVVENVLLDLKSGPAINVSPEVVSAIPVDTIETGSDVAGISTDRSSSVSTPFRPPNRRHEAAESEVVDPESVAGGASLETVAASPDHELTWRTHFNTLATLDTVVSQLESAKSNRAWMGLAMSEEAEEDVEGEGSVVMLSQFDTCVRNSNDGTPKKTSAKGLLMKLNRKYSKAMALVMFHRKKQSDIATRRASRAADRELRGGSGSSSLPTLER
jgi:pentatricopeptide repeat protein